MNTCFVSIFFLTVYCVFIVHSYKTNHWSVHHAETGNNLGRE